MMTPVLDDWNIVLVGAWNTRIFNIAWLGEFIFPGSTVNAYVSLVPGLPTKIAAENIEVIPTEERLLIRPTRADEETIQRLEDKSKEILRLLSHTPVRAVGVNMTYRTDSPTADLLKVFALSDDPLFLENELRCNSCSISRAFPLNAGTMNLILTQVPGAVDLQFNFHSDVENAEQARNYLETRIVPCKQRSLEIARTIYRLELGED